MGFSEAKSKKALKLSKNELPPAIDWLIAHADDPDPVEGEDDDEPAESSVKEPVGEAKSLKCMVCQKIFKNAALASYHGDKSGHDQFEESTEEVKPLTEEERAAKLEELKLKMAQKKAAKAQQDAEDAKKNEAIRRKGGKDMGQIKEEMKIKEAERAAAQARKDKLDDAQAKAKIKAQIEEDKRVRAEKAAKEKALREGKSVPTAPPEPVAAVGSSSGSSSKTHTSARLQIKLPNGGQPLTQTFESKQTLSDVVAFIAEKTGFTSNSVQLSLTYPRRTFTSADHSKSLADLQLVPSAVLIVNI